MNPIIGLITDFGSRGMHYVSAMKQVILKIIPNATIIDIHHDIAPFSTTEASFILDYALQTFPSMGIIVVVVDPGVGTDRDILCLEVVDLIKTPPNGSESVAEGNKVNPRIIIAPNNGLFTHALLKHHATSIFKIRSMKPTSNTFHGRDIMAPAAAHIASLTGLSERIDGNTDGFSLLSAIPVEKINESLKKISKNSNSSKISKHQNYSFYFENYSIEKVLTRSEFVNPEPISKKELKILCLYVDQFGNIITNLDIRKIYAWITGQSLVMKKSASINKNSVINDPNNAIIDEIISDKTRKFEIIFIKNEPVLGKNLNLRIYKTFGDLPDSEPGLILGSSHYLEICIKRGNASKILNIKAGTPLILKKK